MNREIAKTPAIPYINENACSWLTELCFRENDPLESVDLIFVFGSFFGIDKIAAKIKTLLDNNATNKVLITGGWVRDDGPYTQSMSQARLIYEKVNPNEYKQTDFFLEETSTNTLENVTNGLKILDFSNSTKVGFIFSSFAARRGYLTLRKFLSKAQLLQFSFDAHYPEDNQTLTRYNWYTFERGRQRIWGEYLRIKQYSERGDIAIDALSSELIKKIENSIAMSMNPI